MALKRTTNQSVFLFVTLVTWRLTLVKEELQTFSRHPSHPQFSLDLCFFTFSFPILIFSHKIVWSLIIRLLIAYGIFTLSQYAKSIRFIVRGRRLHFCKNCIWSHLLCNMLILKVDDNLCLNFFQLVARKPNLERKKLLKQILFHLSEYSFTCPRLWASGLPRRLRWFPSPIKMSP
jgi:uncharacterized membrane protein (UPF0182 family)